MRAKLLNQSFGLIKSLAICIFIEKLINIKMARLGWCKTRKFWLSNPALLIAETVAIHCVTHSKRES